MIPVGRTRARVWSRGKSSGAPGVVLFDSLFSALAPGAFASALPGAASFARAAVSAGGSITCRTGAASAVKGISANVARIFSNGTIVGLLHESAGTNLVTDSSDPQAATWNADAGGTTYSTVVGPTGASDATRCQATSGNYCRYWLASESAGDYVGSVWIVRGAVGGLTQTYNVKNAGAVVVITPILFAGTSPTVWTPEVSAFTHTGGNIAFQPNNGATLSSPGIVAGARDSALWGVQLEAGTFATSTILSGATAATRPAEILSYPAVATAGSKLAIEVQIRPHGASTAYGAEHQRAWTIDATNYAVIDKTTRQLNVVVNGANVVLPVAVPAFAAQDSVYLFSECGADRLTHAWVDINGTATDLGYSAVPQTGLASGPVYVLSDATGGLGLSCVVERVRIFR